MENTLLMYHLFQKDQSQKASFVAVGVIPQTKCKNGECTNKISKQNAEIAPSIDLCVGVYLTGGVSGGVISPNLW